MRVCVPLLLILSTAASAWADAAVDEQIARLQAPEAVQRLRAVNALARCGRKPACAKAARALEQALFDAAPPVRRGALNALVELDARAAGGSVVRLLSVESDMTVIPAALYALGKLRVEGQDRVITRFASHPLVPVRAAALAAASEIGGPRMRRLALNSLQLAGAEDGAWIVRTSAILALAKIGTADDLALVQRAFEQGGGKHHWMARSAVAKAIAALHPRPRGPLERMLLDGDARVAQTAATGLARAGYTSVLLGHLRHGKSSVRMAAVGGVRQARVLEARARLSHMARFDGSRDVRFAAAITLFEWNDPRADEMMLDALRADDPAIWGQAMAHLARRTGARHGRNVKAWRRALKAARVNEGAGR